MTDRTLLFSTAAMLFRSAQAVALLHAGVTGSARGYWFDVDVFLLAGVISKAACNLAATRKDFFVLRNYCVICRRNPVTAYSGFCS